MERRHTVKYQLCNIDLQPVGDVQAETITGSPIKWMDEKRAELRDTETPEIFIHEFKVAGRNAD